MAAAEAEGAMPLFMFSALPPRDEVSGKKVRYTFEGQPEKILVRTIWIETLFLTLSPKVYPGKDSGASVLWQLKAAIKPALFKRPDTEK